MLKKILCISFLLFNYFSHSQKIYSVEYESQSELNVFVVEYESQSDLKVYRVEYASQSKGNSGLWYFVKNCNQSA